MSDEVKTVEERLKNITEYLDNYEESLHLRISPPNEIDKYLNLDQNMLHRMTSLECDEAAYCLNRFCIFLQEAYNKEHGKQKWAEAQIPILVARTIDNFSGYKYEERRDKAIIASSYASKMNSIRILAEQKANRIAYMTARVESMVHTLLNMSRTKGKFNE